MNVSFDMKLSIPEQVLINEVDDEAVLLNLGTERYFGLDDVGARMLTVLSESDSIEHAYERLCDEFDVDAGQLRTDLTGFIDKLLEQGLVEVSGE